MNPAPFRVLTLGFLLFLLGAILILLGLEGGSPRLLASGAGALFLAIGGYSVGRWLARGSRNPLDERRERRLWKSGPLGRKWLEGRRRIP